MHMNNGRYLTIMDLGRLDLVIRTGLMNLMVKRSCVPVLAAATIRYRLPLAPFQAYTLETQVMCWDNKWVYMEQRFVIRKGAKAGAVAAVALLKGNFWDRRKSETVPTGTLLTLLGIGELSPPMPDHIARWLESEDALKAVTSA
jgi:acyl-CoA thioesterase FadM